MQYCSNNKFIHYYIKQICQVTVNWAMIKAPMKYNVNVRAEEVKHINSTEIMNKKYTYCMWCIINSLDIRQ